MKYVQLILLLFGNLYLVLAQDKVAIRFAKDTVVLKPGKTFKNALLVDNLSGESIVVKRIYPLQKRSSALLTVPDTIKIGPYEQLVFPVKYIADQALLGTGDAIRYTFAIQSVAGITQDTASFNLAIEDHQHVWIVGDQEVIYLNDDQQQQELRFIIENGSYEERAVILEVNSNPSGLAVTGYESAFVLKRKERKWVSFQISRNKGSPSVAPDYHLNILVKDQATGEHITSSHIVATVLSHAHQLFSPQLPYAKKNALEITHNQTSKYFQFTQIKGAFDFAVDQTVFSLSTVLEHYHKPYGFNLYDTWIAVKRDKLDITVGNLTGGHVDFNLSGRGAKVTYSLNDHASVEVVGVENNYQLYSSIYQPYRVSKTIAASYLVDNRLFRKGRFSMLYSRDPYLGIRSKMASFDSGIAIDSAADLRLQGGISHEKPEQTGEGVLGFAIGANYHADVMGWQVHSDNYYSTPSYAGNRRGNINLNERLSRRLNKADNIFIAYAHSVNKPRYFAYQAPLYYQTTPGEQRYTDSLFHNGQHGLNQMDHLRPFFYQRQQLFTAGFTSQKDRFIYTVEPKIEDQRRQSQRFYHLYSYRLGLQVSTDINAQTFAFGTDLSLSQDKAIKNWFYSFKGQLGYHWKGLGINAMYQINPYYISDLEQLVYHNNYWTFSFRPSYNFSIKNSSLNGRISVSTDYINTFASWMKYAEAYVNYAVGNNWEITADLRFTQLDSKRGMHYELNNTQFRVGVRKTFGRRTAIGNHNVHLRFYHDQNNNQELDEQESFVDDLTVRLDDHVSVTDADGKVKYMNVPKGRYSLSVASDEAWRIGQETTIHVQNNTKLPIPLVKVQSVKGALIENRNRYDRYESDIQGIKVYARNEGGIVVSTLTDPEGRFRFYLAPGKYMLYIQNNRYQFNNASQQVMVGSEQPIKEVRFEFTKKEAVIKVKRF